MGHRVRRQTTENNLELRIADLVNRRPLSAGRWQRTAGSPNVIDWRQKPEDRGQMTDDRLQLRIADLGIN